MGALFGLYMDGCLRYFEAVQIANQRVSKTAIEPVMEVRIDFRQKSGYNSIKWKR